MSHHLISRCRDIFVLKFGRCGRCMQQSFAAVLLAWGLFGIGQFMWPDNVVQNLIGVAAVGLAILWILHVAVYTGRAVARLRPEDVKHSERGHLDTVSADVAPNDLMGRHAALKMLARTAKAASIGVVASVPVLFFPTASFAFCGQCTKNADCGVGFVCKNTAAVNSGKVCNECVRA